MKEITNSILKKFYKSSRTSKEHKVNFGKALIIGGNEKYSGATGINSFKIGL